MASKLQPRRIREARMFRGLTQSDLAEIIGITKQAVSQCETGVMTPSAETLIGISKALDFPLAFFSRPFASPILAPIFFRKRKTAAKKIMFVFQTYIEWMAEIYEYVEQHVRLPEVRLITEDRFGYPPEEISRIATELRRHWGLGDGPISDMTLLLENNGFVISKVGLDASKVDACSVFYTPLSASKRPMVFLTSGTSAVRSRRDLAHELGHQVLHAWMDDEEFEAHKDVIEQDAETFASFFLMPEKAMRREGFAVKTLDSLLLMKQRWGASAQSILYHLIQTESIEQEIGERLKKNLYHRGWRMREPGDDSIPQERPEMIRDAMMLLIENDVKTRSALLDDLSIPAANVCELCGFPNDFFEPHSTRPALSLVK